MGKVVKAVAGIGLAAVGFVTGNPRLALSGLALSASSILRKTPKAGKAALDRLQASINPTAPRVAVFGRTAMATDIRFDTHTGADQEYYHQIIAVAAHKVTSIEEIYFAGKLAWSGGTVQTDFVGYLTVATRLEGTSANVIDIDSRWGTAAGSRLTGCAYVHLRFKRTGNSKKSESPFSSSVPTDIVIVGKGMPVYDPSKDSTVSGGSGSHRANDQTTWEYTSGGVDIGRNPALIELTYKLGWRINGVVSVGRGIDPAFLDLPSYITAKNMCNETVTLAAGGTEPRYRLDGIYNEAESGESVLLAMRNSMNAYQTDDMGALGIVVRSNDLGTFTSLGVSDVLRDVSWNPLPDSIEEFKNIGRGRYVDARVNSLYQLVDFPEITSPALGSLDRVLAEDFAEVQSSSQAQRLVKQKLQRLRYPGQFKAVFGPRAYALRIGSVVSLTFPNLRFTNKLFRVIARGVPYDGAVPMLLQEEHASIYAWDAEDDAPVTPSAPIVFNPMNDPLVAQLATIETGADVTATALPDIDGNTTITLDATATGTITTSLPYSRRFRAILGGADVSSTTSFVAAATGLVSASVNNTTDKGLLSIDTGTTGPGEVSLTATFANGAIKNVVIQVLINKAGLPSTGGAGAIAASVNIAANTTFNSTTFVGVTPEIQLTSTAGGTLKVAFFTSYTASAGMTGRGQVRIADTSGGAAVAQTADTVGTAYILNEGPGEMGISERTLSGLTPSTNYFIQGFMRRSSGSGTVNVTGNLTVMQ